MIPHSILEKFAVKLSALEKQSNIQDHKASPIANSKGQFLCIEKQREMISHCLLQNIDESDNKLKGNKNLSRESPPKRKIQIIEESQLEEGEIPDPPKLKINALSQSLKHRVRKTWAKPNVQSYQKAEKIQLETKEQKETKEKIDQKQFKRKSILEDRVRKSWAKHNEQTDQIGEKETKQIKQTHKLRKISHNSIIHLNSQESSPQHQLQEGQQLIVKSLKKVCLNQNNVSYVYMMDNLVSMYLCNRVPSQLIKIYIKQLSIKYEIPYNKILIFFGIEAIIAKFCTSHDISSQFLDNYLCSELEMMLPHLINRVRISNWYVIQRIAQGAVRRLGIKKEITDHWLLTIINKHKKFLREGKVDVDKIFRVAKSREISSLNLCEEPTQNQFNEVNYFGDNMKLFLKRNEQLLQLIQFRDTDEQQVIETSQREGLSNKLTYFKKFQLKAKQNQIQRLKQKEEKKKKRNKKFEDQNILSNEADKFFSSNFQVQVSQQEPQSDISIISQQSYKKSDEDKSFVQAYDEDQQSRRGKKEKKIKQKKAEKQKEITKQRYNLRRGLREESGLIQKQKTSKEQKQRYKTKEKLQKLQIKKQANKKKSKSKSLQSKDKDNQLNKEISLLEDNQISDSPNLLEKLEKTKKGKKTIKKIEIDEQGLMKMDRILFQFFERNQVHKILTIQLIKKQISRILTEEMDIPIKLHRRISNKWLERFRQAKIT